MKKHLALSALGLASLCSGALAQSSVTVFGLIDLSIAHEKNGAGRVTALESGVYQGSRLGFRGTEALGSGVSADFLIEMGINADTGALGQGGLAFGRQAYVGLSSASAGSVRLGRQYTPVYFAQLAVDPFVGGMKGDMASARGWFNNGGVRTNNSVVYLSPAVAGFSATLLYGFGESAVSTSAASVQGASLTYAQGPFLGNLAYHRTENAAGNDSARTWFAGSSFNLGAVKLHAALDRTRGVGTADLRNTMLGLSAPVGTSRLLASWLRQRNHALSDATAQQWSLGVLYPLSKRTALYASAAVVDNSANAAVNAGGVRGASDRVVDVGVRHAF